MTTMTSTTRVFEKYRIMSTYSISFHGSQIQQQHTFDIYVVIVYLVSIPHISTFDERANMLFATYTLVLESNTMLQMLIYQNDTIKEKST